MSALLAVLVAVTLLAGIATLSTLALGWPSLARTWWPRRAGGLRDRAVSRVERFTVNTPMPWAQAPTDAAAETSRGTWAGELAEADGKADPESGDRSRPAAWTESARLRRLASQFASHEELVERLSPQIASETAALRLLLDRQAGAIDEVTATLGAQLRPVRAFADGEESNLRMLQERMEGDDMGVVAQTFSDLLTLQREQIEATRTRIERQREPFAQFLANERLTIERVLERFDGDVDELESALAQQREVTLRLLDAMRSEEFTQVQEFLLDRQQILDEVAASGVTDPSQLAARLDLVRAKHPADAARGAQLEAMLESTAATDARLTAITSVAPEPAQPEPDAEPDAESDDAQAAA